MTGANEGEHAALTTAAMAMLMDAADESRGISMGAEEAREVLGEGEVLGVLGILADYDARMAALQVSVGAARTMLMRVRDQELSE